MRVFIDGRSVRDAEDLHRRLAGAFGYGPGYRPGLEDLEARLRGGDPRPVRLTWTHASALRLALGSPSYSAFVGALERVAAADAERRWAERFVFHVLD